MKAKAKTSRFRKVLGACITVAMATYFLDVSNPGLALDGFNLVEVAIVLIFSSIVGLVVAYGDGTNRTKHNPALYGTLWDDFASRSKIVDSYSIDENRH